MTQLSETYCTLYVRFCTTDREYVSWALATEVLTSVRTYLSSSRRIHTYVLRTPYVQYSYVCTVCTRAAGGVLRYPRRHGYCRYHRLYTEFWCARDMKTATEYGGTVSRHKCLRQYELSAATFISNTTRLRGYLSNNNQLCIDSPEQPEVDALFRHGLQSHYFLVGLRILLSPASVLGVLIKLSRSDIRYAVPV